MQLLTSWNIEHGGAQRTIQLLQGDLSLLPVEHAVDILIVSAFRNDYAPTRTSLIGALHRAGLSVAKLAMQKEIDLREQYSCWLSRPVSQQFAFKRVLCIESGWRGTPPEITDDLFRALAPYLLTDCPNASVAMPLIGTGDQGWPAEQMIESILRAAVSWIHRGLPLRLLKIVVHAQADADLAQSRFLSIKHDYENVQSQEVASALGGKVQAQHNQVSYDIFLSYCHEDAETARIVKGHLEILRPDVRIFFDRTSLKTGASWLMQVAESLDAARRVATLYTSNYWSSPSCKDEFAAAFTRQNDTGNAVLFPIYLRSAHIPYLFRNIEYVDCREGDTVKLGEACSELARML